MKRILESRSILIKDYDGWAPVLRVDRHHSIDTTILLLGINTELTNNFDN